MVAVTVAWYTGLRAGVWSVRAGAWAINDRLLPSPIVHTGRTESPGTRLSGSEPLAAPCGGAGEK